MQPMLIIMRHMLKALCCDISFISLFEILFIQNSNQQTDLFSVSNQVGGQIFKTIY